MRKGELINNLEDYLTELLDSELSDGTIKVYKNAIEQLIGYLPNSFSKKDVIDYKNYLLNELKREIKTVNLHIIAINKYFKWLDHPELKIKQIKTQRKNSVENVATVSDFKRLIRMAKKSDIEIYYIMQIFAYSGIREGELKYITVEGLNEKAYRVSNKGKTRDIIIPQWLKRELKHYCKEKRIKEGVIFKSKRNPNKPIPPSTIWEKMQRVAGKARVNKKVAHPHSLRHRFAKSYLLEHQGAYPELADILGHNDIKTTSIYTQTSLDEKKEQIDNLRFENIGSKKANG